MAYKLLPELLLDGLQSHMYLAHAYIYFSNMFVEFVALLTPLYLHLCHIDDGFDMNSSRSTKLLELVGVEFFSTEKT